MNSPVIRRAGMITWVVLVLCFLATLITRAGTSETTVWFFFYPPLIFQGEVWRIITPTFLHFNVMGSPIIHLLFNSVIWLNFGGAIEYYESRWRLLGLFLLTAIGSNVASYPFYDYSFGGLSGVVYGLIGYLWWRGKVHPQIYSFFPPQMFPVFIGFMLLGFTGLLGNIANVSHLVGLILGIFYAIVWQIFPSKGG